MNNLEECYNILEISNESSIDNVKKQYRKLSLKYHPDKNNNTTSEIFKKITNAYNYILNNNEENLNNTIVTKQNYYNNKYNNHERCNNNYKNDNYIYEKYIYEKYNDDILKILEISFDQAYNGCSIPISINRKIIYNNIINEENETLYINIPNGIDNNEIIILENKGNNVNNNYSNVKITIKLLEHNNFTREGLDIYFKLNLSFKESLIGFEYILKHLNNKNYKIKSKEGEIITNNTKMIMRNLGFCRNEYYGNLIITFNINYQKLDPIILNKLREIF
jgi:DnaJ-class molecular chaperone